MTSHDYQLIDFGDGRKLECFGSVVVDRPCPVAMDGVESEPWECDVRYTRSTNGNGKWSAGAVPSQWNTRFGELCFELATTDSGQVGVFPEQAPNWEWIRKRAASRPGCRVLNLFAYTGGSTLAAAAGGAEVTHVDSAKSVVTRARRNAELSELADAPVRWIVEDAPRFVEREIKRGNRYDGIILDPPSYGHGPKREEWKLSRDLFDLLASCRELLSDQPLLFLLSCHTPGFGAPELSAALSTCLFGSCGAGVRTRELFLSAKDGRRLPAGHAAYWP